MQQGSCQSFLDWRAQGAFYNQERHVGAGSGQAGREGPGQADIPSQFRWDGVLTDYSPVDSILLYFYLHFMQQNIDAGTLQQNHSSNVLRSASLQCGSLDSANNLQPPSKDAASCGA